MRAGASLPKAKVKGLWLMNDIQKHILAKTKRPQILLLVNEHTTFSIFFFFSTRLNFLTTYVFSPHILFFFLGGGGAFGLDFCNEICC